jgi:hypothetical protein
MKIGDLVMPTPERAGGFLTGESPGLILRLSAGINRPRSTMWVVLDVDGKQTVWPEKYVMKVPGPTEVS